MEDKLLEFICIRRCQFKGHVYSENAIIQIVTSEVKDCPECEGAGCEKCKNTGRVSPPHHFMPYNKAAEDLNRAKASAEEDKEKERLRAELKAIGKGCDPAWDVNRLTQEIDRAKHLKSPGVTFTMFNVKKDAVKKAEELEIDPSGKSLKELNAEIKKKMEE